MLKTPRRRVFVGRERLHHIQQTTSVNAVERRLVCEATRRRAAVVLFRAAAESESRWEFDTSFGDKDLERAGLVMALGLLPLQRRFAASGVLLLYHSGWGVRECYAMRQGVIAASEQRAAAADECSALDGWILRHMVQHAALSDTHVLERLLPMHLSMFERRRRRVRALVQATPRRYLAREERTHLQTSGCTNLQDTHLSCAPPPPCSGSLPAW